MEYDIVYADKWSLWLSLMPLQKCAQGAKSAILVCFVLSCIHTIAHCLWIFSDNCVLFAEYEMHVYVSSIWQRILQAWQINSCII